MFTSSADSDASAAATRRSRLEFFHPFKQPHINFIYNLLFCDSIELFRRQGPQSDVEPWPGLLSEAPPIDHLEKLAADETQESRLRAVASRRLHAAGRPVAERRVFGVVVEVPLSHSLDVLAAYADGSVRYINQSGKLSIFDGGPLRVVALGKNLVAAARPLAERIGHADHARMPPPRDDKMRLSMLASDGLCVAEGRFGALQKDALSGPIVGAALALLQTVVESTRADADN